MWFQTQSLGPIQLQPYYSPFSSPLPYYILSLVLPVLVLLTLLGVAYLRHRFHVFPHVFSSMLSVQRRQLQCFGVTISFTPAYGPVMASCNCILRVAIVVVWCFMWQSCIMFQTTTFINGDVDAGRVRDACNVGLVCFSYKRIWDMIIPWIRASSAVHPLCDEADSITPAPPSSSSSLPNASSHVFVTCLGIPYFDTLLLTTRVSIAYALHKLIIASFQMVALLVYQSKGQWVPIGVFCVSVACMILYVVALFVPQLFFSDTWFSSVTYLSLPIILLGSRTAGLAVRNEVAKRLAVRREIRS